MAQGSIRRVEPRDVDEIALMVRELAEYERAPDEAKATAEDFARALFSPEPKVFGHVIEHDDGNGRRLGGFALWFLNFSTWVGKHGLYLEDLYIRPEFRGLGYGKRLLQELAHECTTHGYGRFEWWVLDWNEPAIEFYRRMGAVAMDEWTVYRVTGPALTELGAVDQD